MSTLAELKTSFKPLNIFHYRNLKRLSLGYLKLALSSATHDKAVKLGTKVHIFTMILLRLRGWRQLKQCQKWGKAFLK